MEESQLGLEAVLKDLNMKLLIVSTRLGAIERVMSYYNSNFKDRAIAAWVEELKLAGQNELAETVLESSKLQPEVAQ